MTASNIHCFYFLCILVKFWAKYDWLSLDHRSISVQWMLATEARPSDRNVFTQAYPFSSGSGVPPKEVKNTGCLSIQYPLLPQAAHVLPPLYLFNCQDTTVNNHPCLHGSVQFTYSVVSNCCDPMNHSMPGVPVHHQLPESTQTHLHWVGDAIQPPHPLSSPSPPALNLSQHQGLFKWVSFLHQVAKVLEFQLQRQSFQWIPRTDLL